MTEIFSLHSQTEWLLILLASFIIGLTKAGLKGVDMLSVTLMAIVFGSKASTGIVLPLLCLADIAAVAYYNRHAEWKHFKKLTPWMVVGIVLGVYLGRDMDEAIFRKIMAIIKRGSQPSHVCCDNRTGSRLHHDDRQPRRSIF